MKVIALVALSIGCLFGQQVNPQTITLQAPAPNTPTTVSVQRVGNAGNAQYYYWVVANYPIGQGAPSSAAHIVQAPDNLTGSNYVTVNWNASLVSGALSFDVLRTTTPNIPVPCTCAVATGLSATTSTFNNNSNTINTYTLNPAPGVTANISLDNKDWTNARIVIDTPLDKPFIGNYTIAGPSNILPAAGKAFRIAIVTDGSSTSDCTVGSGASTVLCMDNGSAWIALTGGGGGGGGSPAGPANSVQTNHGGSFLGYANLLNDGTTITTLKTTSNTTTKTTEVAGGQTQSYVETTCANPSSGNFIAGICDVVYTGGSITVTTAKQYANMYGYQLWNYNNGGINSSDNNNKNTTGVLNIGMRKRGGGQASAVANIMYAAGVGDSLSESLGVINRSFETASGGDEGVGSIDAFAFEDSGLVKFTTNALTLSTCNTTLTQAINAEGGSAPASGTNVTVTVASTTGCNVGDWVTVGQGVYESTDTTVDTEQLTGVGGGTISYIARRPQSNGAGVIGAPVISAASASSLFNSDSGIMGIGQAVIKQSGTTYSTGTVDTTNGSPTLVGHGTTWTATVLGTGGNVNMPCWFHIPADDVTSAPFGAGAAALQNWYPCQVVNSNTSITLARAYRGPSHSGATYELKLGARIGGFTIDYTDPTKEVISGLVMEGNPLGNINWTIGSSVEETIPPYQNLQKVFNCLAVWYGPMENLGTCMQIANGSTSQQMSSGIGFAQSALDLGGGASIKTDFSGANNTQNGIGTFSGKDLSGTAFLWNTFVGDAKAIIWQPSTGSGNGSVYADPGGGGFTIDTTQGLTRFGDTSTGDRVTWDHSGLTANQTITIPNQSGPLLIPSGGTVTSRSMPNNTTDEVDIGGITGTEPGSSILLTVQASQVVKTYLFSAANLPSSANFQLLTPLSTNITNGQTYDFQADIQGSGGGAINLRLRCTASPGSVTAWVSIYTFGRSVTFTPSTGTSTVSAPTIAWGGTVLGQEANTLKIRNASTKLVTIDPTAVTANGTIAIPNFTSPDTFCLVTLANCGGGGGGSGNAANVVTTTFSATPTFSCGSSTAGTVTTFLLSTALTANITSSSLTLCKSGQTINFVFTQDGTGGRTVVLPTGFDATLISPTANKTTTLTYAWDGTNGHLINSSNDTQSAIYMSERSAPSTPGSGLAVIWPDSTDNDLEFLANGSGTVFGMVLKGGDVNILTGQVTATHLASPLPGTQGGTGVNNGASTITYGGNVTFSGAFNAVFGVPSSSTWNFQSGGGTIPLTIASGTSVLGTSAIGANTCATLVTTSATGVASTDAISWTPNADLSSVTGYGDQSTDGLIIYPFPTTNNVNFHVCNGTGSSITPGAATLNWRVVR